ncbi:exonuclease 3' [Dinothrombium tinctorium]|uniref:Exonuclease 3 n=1 Tax=Dinothrombium tinctorium TaxID=1965070 RepID=A0A443QE90_9ACAR|nr:exonuclease 3' [Dinothrombium tinctorium]RWS01339.1 exonuclease 3' [Dinothrombium tinctorium]
MENGYKLQLDNARNYIGCKWRLQTETEGEIEGILTDYVVTTKRYTFEKVEIKRAINGLKEGLFGTLKLFRSDIISGEVIESNDNVRRQYVKDIQTPKINISNRNELNQYKIPAKEANTSTDSDDEYDESASDDFMSLRYASESEDDEEFEWIVDIKKWKDISSQVIAVFDLSSSIYIEVMNEIKRMAMIGVHLCGKDISRYGVLEFILIATEKANYVFPNEHQVRSDLKSVFESNAIVKIVSGCQYFADILKNQYEIEVSAVEDIQVIDFFIRETEERFVAKYDMHRKISRKALRSYETCVCDYMNIQIPLCLSAPKYKKLYHYPLSESAKSFVRARVMLLKPLRCIQMGRLLERVSLATEMLFKSFSCAGDTEYESLREVEKNIGCLLTQRNSSIQNIRTTLQPLKAPYFAETLDYIRYSSKADKAANQQIQLNDKMQGRANALPKNNSIPNRENLIKWFKNSIQQLQSKSFDSEGESESV